MKNKFLRIIGLLIGIVCFLWFVAPLLVGGIFNIGNATGILLSLMLMMYMSFMPVVNRWVRKKLECKRVRILFWGLGILSAVVFALAVVETGCIVNTCLRAPAKNATAVVLGCRVYGERPSMSLVERLEAAYEYLTENPEAVCVVSGGKGDGENISEAECMYRWLIDKGIDESRIYKEDRSTSTEENIAYSKNVIVENGLNENIAIITSEYHTYRAGMIAEQNELSYGAVPGHTAIWLFPTFYVRELYAILAEWLF